MNKELAFVKRKVPKFMSGEESLGSGESKKLSLTKRGSYRLKLEDEDSKDRPSLPPVRIT